MDMMRKPNERYHVPTIKTRGIGTMTVQPGTTPVDRDTVEVGLGEREPRWALEAAGWAWRRAQRTTVT